MVHTVIDSCVKSIGVGLGHLAGQESATSLANFGSKSDTLTLLLVNEGRYELAVAFLEVLLLLKIKLCLV